MLVVNFKKKFSLVVSTSLKTVFTSQCDRKYLALNNGVWVIHVETVAQSLNISRTSLRFRSTHSINMQNVLLCTINNIQNIVHFCIESSKAMWITRGQTILLNRNVWSDCVHVHYGRNTQGWCEFQWLNISEQLLKFPLQLISKLTTVPWMDQY